MFERSESEAGPDSEKRVRQNWYWPALIAAGVLGLVVRFHHIAVVTSNYKGGGDPFYFYYWPGVQLARGHGFIDPLMSAYFNYPIESASHPPGFVLLVAGLYKMGFHTANDLRYVFAILGCVTVVLLGSLLGRIISPRAGVIAAVLAAVYPNIWINDTLLMSETLMMFGITVALVGVYHFIERKTWVGIAVASVGLTLAASARPENLILFAAIILPLVLARRSIAFRRRLGLIGLAAVFPLLAFVPWTVYNNARFDKPVLMSTGFGQTMLAGACDPVFSGPTMGLWSFQCLLDVSAAERTAAKPDRVTVGDALKSKEWQSLNEWSRRPNAVPPPPVFGGSKPSRQHYADQSVENGVYVRAALDYMRAHKSEIPKVVFVREARTLELWKPNQNVALAVVEGRGSAHLVTWSQRMFWAMCLLSIAGAVMWRKRKILLYPLYTQMLLVAFVVGVTFGSTRYRAPAELALVLLAATAIDGIVGWSWSRWSSRGERTQPLAATGSTEDAEPLLGG